ncbi:flagellar motor protein MotB [Paracoccus tegillarcae]|uniref:Chemotaxis protein MotB n=1 Tax=Paracoccus tegillarcae TaxID=1529068 RepID=A0A2K9EEI4_9RHOB|nr:flagellar motor protein MotB [Paracoccus tegillarcae]AUH32729.1 chemotaxis protein MotB [Paracoccus tegillarcae]
MDAQQKPPQTRIIVKRVAASGPTPHHGGAWKVAYADFVTAMMAFFLLMWLLNATTEQQRSGLSEYFNPSVTRTPGATGDGIEAGVRLGVDVEVNDTQRSSDYDAVARQVQDQLNGLGAESMQMKNLLKHVVTRMTDEGLVIELTDLTAAPLFQEDSDQAQPILGDLAQVISGALSGLRNDIAISGHVRAYPEALVTSPVWDLSTARAQTLRGALEHSGLRAGRIQRITGFADRRNRDVNPMSPQNNRLEVILLR